MLWKYLIRHTHSVIQVKNTYWKYLFIFIIDIVSIKLNSKVQLNYK